jgi:hypothetical protein
VRGVSTLEKRFLRAGLCLEWFSWENEDALADVYWKAFHRLTAGGWIFLTGQFTSGGRPIYATTGRGKVALRMDALVRASNGEGMEA